MRMSYFPESQLCHRNFRTSYTSLVQKRNNDHTMRGIMAPKIHEKCNIKQLVQVTIFVVVANYTIVALWHRRNWRKFDQHTHDMTQIEGGHIDDRVGAVSGPDSVNRPYRGQAPSQARCQAWLAWTGPFSTVTLGIFLVKDRNKIEERWYFGGTSLRCRRNVFLVSKYMLLGLKNSCCLTTRVIYLYFKCLWWRPTKNVQFMMIQT